MSRRQSRWSSQATANQLVMTAPACCIRIRAASRTDLLNVPEASATTNTWYPSRSAESVGKATHTSVTTPAMTSCFLPVRLTALTKSSLSQALIWPGRGAGDERGVGEQGLQLG